MKNAKNKQYNVIIIGAGASGMMAAITAARKGARVLILEHKDKIGKKILATGNGKCNFTNEHMQESVFRGNMQLVSNGLSFFSEKDTLAFFEGLGVIAKSKKGYIYPNSEQALSIVNALEFELVKLGVDIICSANIQTVNYKAGFEVILENQRFKANKLVVATGLLSNPKLGSDGSFFDVIKSMGHRFEPIVPALCGFYCKGFDFKKASGVRAEGKVQAIIDNSIAFEDYGEIQFADYGLSGIPVFQISRFISLALKQKKHCEISFSLFPDMSNDKLVAMLNNRISLFAKDMKLCNFFNGMLNQKLADAILKYCNISDKMNISALTEPDIKKLSLALSEVRVEVEKVRDYEFSQVCAGGIRSNEINPQTLESLILPGLYFAGEILDVDGPCGGYNLQWAWSSGYIVGNNVYR